MHTTKEINEVIKEAVEVGINLHKNVDAYKLPSESRLNHDALGQCLRSIVDILENENRKTATPQP